MAEISSKNGYRQVPTKGSKTRSEAEEEEAWPEEEEEELSPDELCCCSALQRFATPFVFCALIALISIILGAAFTGTGGGVLTTIEKRFQLPTSVVAAFFTINELVGAVMVLFVAHYGHTRHRPRIIGAGVMLVGLGFLLSALPHFIYDTPPQFLTSVNYASNETSQKLRSLLYPVCQASETSQGDGDEEVCTEEEEQTSGSLMWQVSWIIIGQILGGIGSAALSPLCVTYIDDSMDKSSTAVFLSVLFIAGSLGPLLGFLISGFSLSKHAEFYKGSVASQPGDPNWLGAWWLSYAITGSTVLISGIPILLFPKKMRRRVKAAEQDSGRDATSSKNEQIAQDAVEPPDSTVVRAADPGKCSHIMGFLGANRRLVTNIPFVTVVLGSCVMVAYMVAFFAFLSKYMETQFGLDATTTPILTGFIMTPAMILGHAIGGFVVKRLELTPKGMARMVVILKPLTLLLGPFLLFLGCSNRDMAGLTTSYKALNATNQPLPFLDVGCNADCACPTAYTPVCGSDGVTYVTPCHAGCPASITDSLNTTIYTNCSCIAAALHADADGLNGYYDNVATPGECLSDCNTIVPFVAIALIYTIVGAVIGIPSFMLEMRTVDDNDRSLAIGFASLMMRLLAMIPAPIVYGAVIQTACLLLQSSCGKTGNCLVYDIVNFRYAFHGLTVGLDVLATILYTICYFLIKETKPEATDSNAHVTDSSGSQTPTKDATLLSRESEV